MTFDLETLLRRVKPAKRREPLRRRDRLHFVPDDVVPADVGPVLLDTCVYLDAGKGKLPPGAQRVVAGSLLFHCRVCIAEMAYTFGRLDPAHPDTSATLDFMSKALSRVRVYRTFAARVHKPDHNIANENRRFQAKRIDIGTINHYRYFSTIMGYRNVLTSPPSARPNFAGCRRPR